VYDLVGGGAVYATAGPSIVTSMPRRCASTSSVRRRGTRRLGAMLFDPAGGDPPAAVIDVRRARRRGGARGAGGGVRAQPPRRAGPAGRAGPRPHRVPEDGHHQRPDDGVARAAGAGRAAALGRGRSLPSLRRRVRDRTRCGGHGGLPVVVAVGGRGPADHRLGQRRVHARPTCPALRPSRGSSGWCAIAATPIR
jgi:hypothetical protein